MVNQGIINSFYLHYLVIGSIVGADVIHIYNISTCNPKTDYPVTVSNVDVAIVNGKLSVSGSLSTINDLRAPINANLIVKRYVNYWGMNFWTKVLCVDGYGSCSYADLCYYGVPNNNPCPQAFVNNDVPCRCPIPRGNYTMGKDQKIELGPVPKTNLFSTLMDRRPIHVSTPLTGLYYITVSVSDSNFGQLACYNIYVSYNDEVSNPEEEQITNEIVPFVELTP